MNKKASRALAEDTERPPSISPAKRGQVTTWSARCCFLFIYFYIKYLNTIFIKYDIKSIIFFFLGGVPPPNPHKDGGCPPKPPFNHNKL